MVRLTRIYTRTGDDGTTGYGGRGRISKNDSRLQAYADCDEAGAFLGVALAEGELDDDVATVVRRVQNDLFDVGADLCTPVEPDPAQPALRIVQEQVDALEREIDRFNEQLSDLRSFVLAGGTRGGAHLHVARTVVRRAERSTWRAIEAHPDSVNPLTATYLNRLSDLLFVLARYANRAAGDVLWVPGANR
jgi:cob(I)alamin adenosyltransferase